MTPTVDNIIASYLRASDEALEDGLTWYRRAREFALTLDENVERAAGIIAAMSPNTSWTANKTFARNAYMGHIVGLPANVAKVHRMFAGEHPLDVLGGPKVRAFYANIVEPDASHPAVIDRHAFDIAVGKRLDDKSRGSLSRKGVYDSFASVYSAAAELTGHTTGQVQAITWVEWRARNGITV